LPKRYIVAVRVLDAELSEPARGVVDRPVDVRSAPLRLGVHRVGVIDTDVNVYSFVGDLRVGNDSLFGRKREQDYGCIAARNREIGRVAVQVAVEAQAIPVERHGAFEISDQQERRDTRKRRYARSLRRQPYRAWA